MANKQITDLNSSLSADLQDLLLIRKSSQSEDTNININNFITSIGNPAISGYYQNSYDNVNNIISLKPSNGTNISGVGEGMKVSFLATNDVNGQAYITFDGNQSYPLYQYNKNLDFIPASIESGDYIESIFTNDKLFQTNIPTTQIYTNDYIAEGVVTGDQSSTTYALTSAIGVPAQSYYNGMSIIFTSDIDSKGSVLVNVDGLGNKILTDKAGDMIANNLAANQVILAIYDGNNFIKNYFSENVPEAPELPAEAFDDEGDIIIENVPDENKVQVTTGSANNDYDTIQAAIDDLVSNYGDNGGNRVATILLSATYIWNEKLVISDNDYSWITIHAPNEINITEDSYIKLINSSITISGSYNKPVVTGLKAYFITCEKNSKISMENFHFTSTANLLSANNSEFNIKNDNNNYTIDIINSPNFRMDHIIYARDSKGIVENVLINNSGKSSFNEGSIYLDNSTININNFNYTDSSGERAILSKNSKLYIVDSDFNLSSSGSGIISTQDNFFSAKNTNITGPGGQFCLTLNGSSALLDNCVFKTNGTSTTVIINENGADTTIIGGSYTQNDGSTNENNIVSRNPGTVVRLKDNPVGGFKTADNGVITTG